MHSYQDQFIQPGWAECVFSVFSLGLCFVYSFVPFDLFVCLHSEQLSHLPYIFGVSVTNSNEAPRALAASTITWVRS